MYGRCVSILCVLFSVVCFAVNSVEADVAEQSFCGKVVDVKSQPVAGAFVVLNLLAKGAAAEKIVVSDPNGLFEFKCSADTVEVKTVFREGYIPDTNRPIVFHKGNFGKIGRPVEIVMNPSDKPGIARNDYEFTFWANSSKDCFIDLSEDRGKLKVTSLTPKKPEPEKPSWGKKDKSAGLEKLPEEKKDSGRIDDIKVSASFLVNEQVWKVQVVPVSSGTAFQALDEVLSRCPLEGYSTELELVAAVKEPIRKYIYVRARDSRIYSRLVLDVKANEKVLSVNMSNRANTMASPILEINENGMPFFDSDKDKLKQQNKEKHEKQERRQKDKERRYDMGN
jgi:hypothetical protein